MNTDTPEKNNSTQRETRKKWLKRLGVAGFFFFLAKGIAWIIVALWAWKGCS